MTRDRSFISLRTSHSGGVHALVVICAFAAALCWWIGLTGYVLVGGPASRGVGLLVFVATPALATLGTYFVARRTGRTVGRASFAVPLPEVPGSSHPARHRATEASGAATRPQNPPTSGFLVRKYLDGRGVILVTAASAAALLWWIGLTGFLAVGGAASGPAGAGTFLALPAAATVGTYLAARRRRHRVPRSA